MWRGKPGQTTSLCDEESQGKPPHYVARKAKAKLLTMWRGKPRQTSSLCGEESQGKPPHYAAKKAKANHLIVWYATLVLGPKSTKIKTRSSLSPDNESNIFRESHNKRPYFTHT
ncbi:hypothetical protein ElyMa_001595600 [Elysia marginata]|uniref:Uncharacterized protein n=1 Tax=Elysia marginata TaxID=1093978 RepID=A0AAV4JI04_9GAST|nr:hypothetical protein ElyMa_001595600 [Elysia marginata]